MPKSVIFPPDLATGSVKVSDRGVSAKRNSRVFVLYANIPRFPFRITEHEVVARKFSSHRRRGFFSPVILEVRTSTKGSTPTAIPRRRAAEGDGAEGENFII